MSETIRDLVEPSEQPEIVLTASALLPFLYDDLHRLARRERRNAPGDTLQTTALIHEAYLKLRDTSGFTDRDHFLRASALAMRNILVNHARGQMTAKRGSGAVLLSLEDHDVAAETTDDALLIDVNDALGRLAALNMRLARVVECRFFAGYSDQETAEALGTNERTVRRDWIKARAWLMHELTILQDPAV
jgi:RNA polymerase sigma factor (TIGR02999 family)